MDVASGDVVKYWLDSAWLMVELNVLEGAFPTEIIRFLNLF